MITVALTGVITRTDIDAIRQMVEEVALARKHWDECLVKMEKLCSEWVPETDGEPADNPRSIGEVSNIGHCGIGHIHVII